MRIRVVNLYFVCIIQVLIYSSPLNFFQGILAAVPLAYILPAMCYLQLEEGFIFCSKKLPALGVVIFGLTVAGLGLVFMIIDYEKVESCSGGKVMEYCNITSVIVRQTHSRSINA